MSCLKPRSKLLCSTALIAAVVLFAPSTGDASLTLHYIYLLDSGSTIAQSVVKGPVPTYTGNNGTSLIWDENAALVSTTNNEPRFTHHPVTGAAEGLLRETQRVNKCLQANDLETTWTNPGTNTTITANAGTFPDGNATMDDVLHGDSAETIQQTITVTNNTKVGISAFVSQGTTGSHDWVKMSWIDESDGDNGFEAWFDLSTGNVGTAQAVGTGSYSSNSAKMTDVGGGVFRIEGGGQIVTGQTDGRFEIINTTADGVDTAEVTNSVFWGGFQLEEVGTDADSAHVTSFIPTTTGAVTRTEDLIVETTLSWFADSSAPGTLYTKYINGGGIKNGTTQPVISINDGSNTDTFRINLHGSVDAFQARIRDGNSDVSINTGGIPAVDTLHQVALAWAIDDVEMVVDGSSVVTDTSVTTLPEDLTQLSLGDHPGGTENIEQATYQEVQYFNNVRKTQAFMEALTS
jgi:hypothetical protein